MAWQSEKYTLKYPVEMPDEPGKEVTIVVISMPRGRQLRQIEKVMPGVDDILRDGAGNPVLDKEGSPILPDPTLDQTMNMIQILSDLPPNGVDELHPHDITALAGLMGPFLEAALGGGPIFENSSGGGSETKSG